MKGSPRPSSCRCHPPAPRRPPSARGPDKHRNRIATCLNSRMFSGRNVQVAPDWANVRGGREEGVIVAVARVSRSMMSSFFLNAKEDEARTWPHCTLAETWSFASAVPPLTNQLLFAWRCTFEFRIIFRGLNTKSSKL